MCEYFKQAYSFYEYILSLLGPPYLKMQRSTILAGEKNCCCTRQFELWDFPLQQFFISR